MERAEANAPESASPASRRDELHGIDDALRGLPQDQRRAFVLREWRGFSYAEIAETMGVTNSAVESLIFRARRGLAASLEGGVQQVRAGGFAVLELGSLLSGFKASILGVVGTTGAKVAASVAVVTTATTVAAAPSHPRLSHFLMAPLEAAKSGVHEILAPEKKSDGNGRIESAVQASAAGLPTVAIVSQGTVVGVRPVTAAALAPELAPVPAVPLPPEVVDPVPVPEGGAPPIETLPPEEVPVDQPPAEAPPTEGQVPLPEDTVPPPEEAPPPVETSGGTDAVVPPPEPVEESGASPRTETSTEPSSEPAPSTDEAVPDVVAPDVAA